MEIPLFPIHLLKQFQILLGSKLYGINEPNNCNLNCAIIAAIFFIGNFPILDQIIEDSSTEISQESLNLI